MNITAIHNMYGIDSAFVRRVVKKDIKKLTDFNFPEEVVLSEIQKSKWYSREEVIKFFEIPEVLTYTNKIMKTPNMIKFEGAVKEFLTRPVYKPAKNSKVGFYKYGGAYR